MWTVISVHGAKGSVKNRIYQFWLIQFFLKKKKKRKQNKQLKQKRKEEIRKKRIQELIGYQERPIWKLSKSPTVFNRKEGIIVTLYPPLKKTNKVIAIKTVSKKAGIDYSINSNVRKKDVLQEKKLVDIVIKTTDIMKSTKEAIKEQPKETSQLEKKKKQLERELTEIEVLHSQYQSMIKKNPSVQNRVIVVLKRPKKIKVHIDELLEIKTLCKKEIQQIEETLKQSKNLSRNENNIRTVERKEPKIIEETPKKNQNPAIIPKEKEKKSRSKTSFVVLSSGALIAYPALLTKLNAKSEKKAGSKKASNLPLYEKNEVEKTLNDPNHIRKESKQDLENKTSKMKLYRLKLEASKETEILIQAEIERQRGYLKVLNEKVSKLDITVKTKHHFMGIHHLISNLLKFTLGIFTIPFSRKRIFGTAVGLVLINNSIRGMKNSFKEKKEQVSYIQFKDFSNAIYNEQRSLLKINELVVDSLSQLKDLKKELENQYCGRISFSEYSAMQAKLETIEYQLIEKQKEIEQMQAELNKVNEKNKVKMKKIEDYYKRQ